jgi:hypothetical protein
MAYVSRGNIGREKTTFAHSLAKLKQFLKSYELFIYGDLYY